MIELARFYAKLNNFKVNQNHPYINLLSLFFFFFEPQATSQQKNIIFNLHDFRY